MKALYVIPARGGSKGIPGKNIRPLAGKPLICYAIDVARRLAKDECICVSTDDIQIIKTVEEYNLDVPFVRPAALATDTAGSYEVLLHALKHYEDKGERFDCLVLLQPTSPFRTAEHVRQAMELYKDDIDMVVSVKEAKGNPYYNLFEENNNGFLELCKKGDIQRRQNATPVYEYNGAVYVINVRSLKQKKLPQFEKVKKYVMGDADSLDLDTPLDWAFAEFLVEQRYINMQV